MPFTDEDSILTNVTADLTRQLPRQRMMLPHDAAHFPSVENLKEIMQVVKTLVFPDFFDYQRDSDTLRGYFIGAGLERLVRMLRPEIEHAQQFRGTDMCREAFDRSQALTLRFVDSLPAIKELLYTDVEAIQQNDPAVDNFGEIILSYPVVTAMIHYRAAHALQTIGIPVIPRILTELAHSATGIDINPCATIGRHFAIDHGTGVVIGQTCIIGDHVTLYQGVTLGAKNFTLDDSGHPVNLPRHPIIEDNVTIYSNATILGRITIGHDSIIGGNVWLTESVPPNSKIVQKT